MHHHLERLRYVTERYRNLQGLRLIPLAIPFLFSSAWRDGRLSWIPAAGPLGARLWFIAMFAAALAVSLSMGTFYRRRFGTVRPAGVFYDALSLALFASVFVVAVAVQGALNSPVSYPAVVVALGLAGVGLAGGQLRPHYLIVAAFAAVFAVLGPLGVPYHTREVLFDQLVGIGLIVIGAGDHLLLRGTLAPVPHVDSV